MKICFATEVTYPNYVNRLKKSSLKCFLDKKLDELGISYYISTNLPNELSEYTNNNKIKVFDIETLRAGHEESKQYELYPEDPTGLYPSKYPWNARRFIIEKAALDGFNYIIYVDADNVFNENMSGEDILRVIQNNYEPNTVKTNSVIFRYVNKTPDDVFNFHPDYIKHFNLSFDDEQYNTIDGPCQVFIGATNLDVMRLTQYWHQFAIFGYKKEFGFGYGNNKHGNLSFVIPLSRFALKWCDYPLHPNHVYEDRYTHENKVQETPSPTQVTDVNEPVSYFLSKNSCDQVPNYSKLYNTLFAQYKTKQFNFLQIGVGTVATTPLEGMSSVPSSMAGWKEKNVSYFPGASLRAYRDYFVNASIYGIDIQPDCLLEEHRLKTFLFDSTDKNKCNEKLDNLKFDIIIDDGDHDPLYQIRTLENLFDRVVDDGLYIIEDIINQETISNYLLEHNYNFNFYRHDLAVIKKNGNEIIKNDTEQIVTLPPQNIVIEKQKSVRDKFKINGVQFADAGYFINLDKSVDRLNLLIKQMVSYQIEGLYRFPALTDEWVQFSCTKSHLKVFEQSLQEGYEIIFVAEDDMDIRNDLYLPYSNSPVLFRDKIKEVYDDLKNVEWDVLLFGCNPKTYLIPLTNNLAEVHRSTGAWAYLIKKRAYEYVLNNLNYHKDLLAIDDYLPRLNDVGFKTLCTIPLTINHSVGLESTLQPRGPVNYDSWIHGNFQKFLYDFYKGNLSDFDFERNVTIVIAGHYTENFLFYLNYLLYSLPNRLLRCKFIINYDDDGKSESCGDSRLKLIHYLRDKKSDLNCELSFSKGGLIASFDNVLRKIKTPYFIFLEHDWVFLNKDIEFDKLKLAFDNNAFVNAVWFAKDDNTMRGFEIAQDVDGRTTPFELEKRVTNVKLTTTCRWSNNPVMFRTSKMKYWFETFIRNEHVGVINQGSYNIEEVMIDTYRQQISKNKWEDIRDEWGTFLYGNIGDGPYVGHTDASRRYLGTSRSQPEINGDNFILNNPIVL